MQGSNLREARTVKQIAAGIKKAAYEAAEKLRGNEDAVVEKVRALLQEVEAKIRYELAQIPEESFKAFHLNRIQKEIDAVMAEFETKAAEVMKGSTAKAFQITADNWHQKRIVMAGIRGAPTSISIALPQELLGVTSAMSAELIRGISDQLRKEIVVELQRVLIGGQSPFEAARTLTDLVGVRGNTGAAASAERIVRTEVNRAYNLADNSFIQNAVDERPADLSALVKIWVSMDDDRVRASHEAMHKTYVPGEERFTVPIVRLAKGEREVVGSEEMDGPGDPSASPGNTINCRCKLITVPEDLLEETLAEIPGDTLTL